ncbi:MAG: Na(+)/H(+) antiporter subunit D [Firmicutes bacterium]|nr:Na(+)/H(+) antiporter subunit D [Bacillota bacterium]
MSNYFPPAILFIIGALLIPFFRGRVRQAFIVLLPSLAFVNLFMLPEGIGWTYRFLDYELILARVDRLSMVFGYIFVIMAFAGAIYSLHVKNTLEHIAAFIYVGSSLGVVFAGDYLSLYVFWEVMAFSSVCLICASKTRASQAASFRYILVHIFGGLVLLAGIIFHVSTTGSIKFEYLGLSGLASYLILFGFALNAAIPPLSAWLSDAYPEGTVAGTVFLSAYTTKTAVYTLARAFPGTDILVWAGTIMTLYGIVYAILENDMRRVLAYSIINQVGFMVAGIGIGTAMALNGATAHAFAHILYKALLMMSAGAVLFMTGRSKTTELGGLYKSMPITLLFCLVGAASISAFPLTGGFVSKSMVIVAAGEEKKTAIWLLLNLASAGVFLHAGIKFPYFVFFAKDSGLRPSEPPVNMLIGMGILAFLCIFIGVFPGVLYHILPFPVEYVPYTAAHVVGQLQLLMFSALAFFILLPYLQRTNTITLDTDWIYRRGAQRLLSLAGTPLIRLSDNLSWFFNEGMPKFLVWFGQNPPGALKIAADTIVLSFSGQKKRAELKKQLEMEKELYPADRLYPWSIGAAVSLVLLLFFVYLFFL